MARPECPCITVTNDKITFNVFCMRKFAGVSYVQLLLHPTERKLAIRPCGPTDTHHIRWRVDPEKPFIPKSISCPHFGNALFKIMNWNPDFVYHIRGSWAGRARDEIIVFPLSNAAPAAYLESAPEELEEGKKRRVEMCPEEWSDSFGEEFYSYALENSFYFLAPKSDWKADTEPIEAPGIRQLTIMTEEELEKYAEELRQTEGTDDNG